MKTVTGALRTILGVSGDMKVSFRLCGFGNQIPTVSGVAIIPDTAPIAVSTVGGAFSVDLYANSDITPLGTFYTVQFQDDYSNILFSANYQFTGSGTVDLSTLTPYNQSASPLNGLYQTVYYSGNAALPNTSHPVLALATGGSFGIALTLPPANLALRSPITVKKVDAGAGSVYVQPYGSDTIEGNVAYEISNEWQHATFVPITGGWCVIASN